MIALTGAGPPNESKIGAAANQKTEQVPSSPTPAALAEHFTPYPDRESNDCYQDGNHERSDLCAQWRAALAAEKAAKAARLSNLISGVGALLSFISILFVVAALRQARDANRISAKEFALSRIEAKTGAKHSERALEIASAALSSDREIGEAQVRAYLTPTEPAIGFEGFTPIFKFKLVNTGNSPAFFITAGAQMRFDIDWPTEADNRDRKSRFVGTLRQSESSREIILRLPTSIKDCPLPPIGPAVVVQVYVNATWIDVFKKTQKLRCRYTIVMNNHLSESRTVRISESGLDLDSN